MTESLDAIDPWYPNRPYTVCFYSFRGGVGRTTLAVSTALALASPRSRVFLLDFDLEAPGIDEFEATRPAAAGQAGLVEYVRAYLESGHAHALHEYVYGVLPKSEWVAAVVADLPTGSRHHALTDCDARGPTLCAGARDPLACVMRAGRRDNDHCRFIAQFDWEKFYAEKEGQRFFENLRAGARTEFGCDYMLVDSRTGLTRIGGVCLGHLADAVVFVFQPTTAHGQGLERVVGLVRDRERKEERLIPRLYVASKVPMPYEDAFDKDACELAEELVKRCEGTSEIYLWPSPARDDYEFLEPRAGVPALTLIRAREHVPHPHDPDAYVVQRCPGSPEPLSAIEAEYVAVVDWIVKARRAVAPPSRPSV